MSLVKTRGAVNNILVYTISGGTVQTPVGFEFKGNYSFDVAEYDKMLLGTGGSITSNQVENSPDLDQFLQANLVELEEATQGNKFVDGTMDEVASTQTPNLLVLGTLGLTGGKHKTFVFTGFISANDFSVNGDDNTQIGITFTFKPWTGSNLTLPAGIWDNTIWKTTTPTPALPTEISDNAAGEVIWLEEA